MVVGWETGVRQLTWSALMSVLTWVWVLSVKMEQCPVTMVWTSMVVGLAIGVPWLERNALLSVHMLNL